MAETGEQDKGRTAILSAVGLLLAIGGLVGFFAVRNDQAKLGALEHSGKRFLTALGSGDSESACGLMTRTAQSKLTATQHTDTCPQAVEALVSPLSRAERAELADSYASRFFPRDGGLGHINVDDNALQISELLLSNVDGKWLVTDWR